MIDNVYPEAHAKTCIACQLINSHLVLNFILQMGGGGCLVPVSREGLSSSEEVKVRTWPNHRHSAWRPGRPEGGTLLPQEGSWWGVRRQRQTRLMSVDSSRENTSSCQIYFNVGCLQSTEGCQSCRKPSFYALNVLQKPQRLNTMYQALLSL